MNGFTSALAYTPAAKYGSSSAPARASCTESNSALNKLPLPPARPRSDPLQRLRPLVEQGRLLVAGLNPVIDGEEPGQAGWSGSLIIAEFDSREDARAWAEEDPYVAAGVYASAGVKPLKKALT